MTSGDIKVLQDSIKNLLSGVNSAFVTSLVGIGGGLAYNVAHNKLLTNFHDKIAQLTDALDEKFPHRSVEDWLSKNFPEAQVQTTTLQSIDTESKEQTSALKNIGIDAKLKTADDIAKLMNEQMLTTLQELREALRQQATDSAAERAEAQKKFLSTLDGLTGTLNAAAENNAAQISEAVAAFREIVDRHNAATKKTFADIQSLLAETETYLQRVADAGNSLSQAAAPVKESSAQLTRNLSETAAQMNTLATANQTTRENLAALSERLATFTKNFNGIANEFERSTNIIRDSLDNYNGKISDGLTNALTQFDKFVNTALGGLNELLEAFNDTVGYVKQKRR